jgi:hypothetical protein
MCKRAIILIFIDIVPDMRIIGTKVEMEEYMSKTRLNISTDQDLADFIKIFAAENRTTIAEIFTQYILSLKNRIEGEKVHDILANPYFRKSMDEAQEKLQSGTAVWHTYDDVFGS